MNIKAIIAAATMAAFAISSPVAAKKKPDTLVAKADAKELDCVNLAQIRETRVRDDNTIDFHMQGGKIYRNTLPMRCPQLGFEEKFSYKTSLSQLCSTDIITVLTTTGGGLSPGASCGLGHFQEMVKATQ
ncbi:hypothetical protein [Sphingomonas sp. KC8]|uniref:hypothetical protein n=1 Tax=Sphingomonas sp. KC8 TaxID=1030157 RepID=UPI0002489C62|nr:hypothetical protein [Sphingomonas sp. KC8]ARS26378.1 hypothetical protein KC8_03605 [Sphingomonas sp. KC8]